MIKVNIRPMCYSNGFLFTRANEKFSPSHGIIEIGETTNFYLKIWTDGLKNCGIKYDATHRTFAVE